MQREVTHPRNSRLLLLIFATALLSGCHPGPVGAEMSGSRPSSGPELHGVRFKPGMPEPGQPLSSSVSDPEQATASLEHNAALIRGVPTCAFDVIGSTDNVECSGSDCQALAHRRAQLVRRWLIENGVSDSQLRSATVDKRLMPATFVGTEEDRSFARVARLQIVF